MTELKAYRDARKYLIESQGELQFTVNEFIKNEETSSRHYHYYRGRLEELETILEIMENVDR